MELRDGKNDFFDTGTELIDTETFPDSVVLSFFVMMKSQVTA